MKKIILITGWIWYIWSHWVVAFEQAWYKTVIIDNLYNSSIKTLNWIEKIIWYKPDFFELDLRNKKKLEEVFKKYNFDWVLHLAWLKAVGESCEKPLEYFDNNIWWSILLFNLMKKYNVLNMVFSSSATVYDKVNKSPINESMLIWQTTNPYWTTKLLTEKILEDLSKFSDFNVINLRYFNPIWAHESWYIWEDPEWIPNNLLPYILKVARWDLKEVWVFWNDYDTIDGTWVRDYIDVVDLINGHLKAYNNICRWFNTYNLWVGRWVSVLEMINKTEKISWKKINYKILDRRNWDLWEVFCDASKAEIELWWKAKVSLENSLKNSWKFINKWEWNKKY
jgi:UDP-glucose 4-epimerase